METLWIENTVYPEVVVWCAWFDNHPVIENSLLGVRLPSGDLCCGFRLSRVEEGAEEGGRPTHTWCVKCHGAGQVAMELAIEIGAGQLSCLLLSSCQSSTYHPVYHTNFPRGAVWLNSSQWPEEGRGVLPKVYYTPHGKMAAYWCEGFKQNVVFFDRPGEMAEQRLGVLELPDNLRIDSGAEGVDLVFLKLPFTHSLFPPELTLSAGVSPGFVRGFGLFTGADGDGNDYWIVRGEPGEFAVVGRRYGAAWRVGGITAKSRTISVRFEDFWLRTPSEYRTSLYKVVIHRDPNATESLQDNGEVPSAEIVESFDFLQPNVVIRLDMAANGGFLLLFTPQR